VKYFASLMVVFVCASLWADMVKLPTAFDENGFLRVWAVLGPFPNPVPEGLAYNDHTKPDGLDVDYLGGESEVSPIIGKEEKFFLEEMKDMKPPEGLKEYRWQFYISKDGMVNFDEFFKPNDNVVAYAGCFIYAEREGEVEFLAGSDDGMAVWLNGERIHYMHKGRALQIDEDRFTGRVRKGWNRLLVKVEEGIGGWGFALRVGEDSRGGLRPAVAVTEGFDMKRVFDMLLLPHWRIEKRAPLLLQSWVGLPEKIDDELVVRLVDIEQKKDLFRVEIPADKVFGCGKRIIRENMEDFEVKKYWLNVSCKKHGWSKGTDLWVINNPFAPRIPKGYFYKRLRYPRDGIWAGDVLTAPYTNKVYKDDKGYHFAYIGEDEEFEYIYRPAAGGILQIYLVDKVNPQVRVAVCEGGGIKVADGEGKDEAQLLRGVFLGNRVMTEWIVGGAKCRVILYIKGKSLVIETASKRGEFTRVDYGRVKAEGIRTYFIPYMTYRERGPLVGVVGSKFLTVIPDWYYSHASKIDIEPGKGKDWAVIGGYALYEQKTDGTRNPLRERVFITYSSKLWQVLPRIPNPPSPYLKFLADKVVLDWWIVSPLGKGWDFYETAEYLKKLKYAGLDKLLILYHGWQHYGFDSGYPTSMPANDLCGGDEGLKYLVGTARKLGFTFALHENWVNYLENSPVYTSEDVALNPDGSLRTPLKGWHDMKPTRVLAYAKVHDRYIRKVYGTNAHFVDVNTAIPLWGVVDFDAKTPDAGKFHQTLNSYAMLFRMQRRLFEGPVLGEGWAHFAWAGLIDGVEAQIEKGIDRPVIVDFDLLRIHPLMVNHGMGYACRWDHKEYQVPWGPYNTDKYRATEIAFGHAGMINDPAITRQSLASVAREYYMLQQLQAKYNVDHVECVRYFTEDGQVLTTEQALLREYDFGNARVFVRYRGGLEVFVNRSKEEWEIETELGKFLLPPTGFLAKDEEDFLEYSILSGGKRVDFVWGDAYIYFDPRGKRICHNGFEAQGALALKRDKGSIICIAISEEKDVKPFKIPWKAIQKLGLEGEVEVFGIAEDGRKIPIEFNSSRQGFEVRPEGGREVERFIIQGRIR